MYTCGAYHLFQAEAMLVPSMVKDFKEPKQWWWQASRKAPLFGLARTKVLLGTSSELKKPELQHEELKRKRKKAQLTPHRIKNDVPVSVNLSRK